MSLMRCFMDIQVKWVNATLSIIDLAAIGAFSAAFSPDSRSTPGPKNLLINFLRK